MIDLSSFQDCQNPNCPAICTSKHRKSNAPEGICDKTKSVFDKGPIRCVNPWSREKIHFLSRYFDMFTTSMKGEKWNGNINYIEICCGPGICVDRESSTEFLGTSLAIAQMQSFKNLNQAVFVDISQDVVEVLNKRLDCYGIANKATAIQGDYNHPEQIIQKVKSLIPNQGLNLIFIDPTDMSIPFLSVQKLSEGFGKADLIINIMYGSDAKRGFGYAFNSPSSKARRKYARFLGTSEFFEDDSNKVLNQVKNHEEIHRKFVQAYLAKLKDIDYIYTGHQAIRNYYELFFASKHKLALKFWDATVAKEFSGQRKLF